MSHDATIEAIWDGEVFRPTSPYMMRRADKQFAKGEVLRLTHNAERSSASHAHLFAQIKETWRNLPPLLSDRFPSEKHLRKFALIKAGYFDSQSMPCGSPAAARRFAAFVKPLDEFAVVTVDGSVVNVFTAKSIAYNAMDKKTFAEMKEKVLGVLAEMIGVARQELADNAGRAA